MSRYVEMSMLRKDEVEVTCEEYEAYEAYGASQALSAAKNA